ncbi:MAG: ribosomal L7Ae/L30e/S12e/Gadd45 family protein [Candidatus Pacearchaeota archaeon]
MTIQSSSVQELLKETKKNRFVVGSKRTLKFFNKNLVEKIYLSSDAPAQLVKKIEQEKKYMKNINIVKVNATKEELKELLKKKFNISVIAILKESTEKTEK